MGSGDVQDPRYWSHGSEYLAGQRVTVASPVVVLGHAVALPGDTGYVVTDQRRSSERVRVRFPETGEDHWFDAEQITPMHADSSVSRTNTTEEP